MIEKLFVYDIKCGQDYVPTNDIKQIIARCGRTYHKHEQGTAYIFAKKEDVDQIDEYLYGEVEETDSMLTSFNKISFNLLPQIKKGKVRSKEEFELWFSRSLAYHQGIRVDSALFEETLINSGLIDKDWNLSLISDISCKYYYDIETIKIINNKLINNYRAIDNYFVLSYLMSYQKINGYIKSPHYEEFNESLQSYKFDFNYDESLQMYMMYCILNNYRPNKLKSQIYEFINNLHRFYGMFEELCYFNKIENMSYIKDCKLLMLYNVNEDTLVLMNKLNCWESNVVKRLLLEYNVYTAIDFENKVDYINEVDEDEVFLQKCNEIRKSLSGKRHP